ncbi:unnamed protein product [Closterium sp. Yama58-4]|nr:unnamed protein product [Closterium sp. Yama58-4]
MSGLDSGSFRRPLDSDTVATRFLHGRHSAMQFAVMQLGVCTFKWDEGRKEFIVHPFNFKVFPRSEIPGFKGVPAHSFQCQPSSLEFLAAHHLDFNSWVHHGISYLSYEQEEAAWNFLEIPPPSATATNIAAGSSQKGAADVAQPANRTQFSTSTSSTSRYRWRDSSDRSDPSSPPFPGVQFAVKSLARVDLWLAQLRAAAQEVEQEQEEQEEQQQEEQPLAKGVASSVLGEGPEGFSREAAVRGVGGDGSSSSSSGLQPALAAVVGKRPWLSLRINDAFNCHAADQAIRHKHPYLASHEERIGAYKKVRLFLCKSKEEAERLQERLLELRQAGAAAVVRRAVGVRRVVDAVSLACQSKPLVAHSCFLDLSHILHKFVGHVPPSPALFSREVRRLFPALFDTTCLAAASLVAQEAASTNRRASLGALYDTSRNLPFVDGAPMRVRFSHEAGRYSASNGQDPRHEAAYDAFMTGVVFAQTCHRLGKGTRDIHLDLATGHAAIGSRAAPLLASLDTLTHGTSYSFSSFSPTTSTPRSTSTSTSTSTTSSSSSSSTSSSGREEEDRSNVLFLWGLPPSLPHQRLRFLLRGALGRNTPLDLEPVDSGAALVRFGSGKERDVENLGKVMWRLGRALVGGAGRGKGGDDGGGGGSGVRIRDGGERLGESEAVAKEMVSLGIRAAPFSAFVTLCESTVPFLSATEGANVIRLEEYLVSAAQRSPDHAHSAKTSRTSRKEGRGARCWKQ